MIASDSPLRLLPPGIDGEQMLILDGIRHAGEVCSFAFERLARGLTELAHSSPRPAEGEDAKLQTAVYLDAWAIVDAIDRLRMLVALLPMDAAAKAQYDEKVAQFAGVRLIRNVADHLAQRIQYVLANDAPAFGALSWFTLTAHNEGFSCVLLPGAVGRRLAATVINPAGKAFEPPTDHITMTAGEHRASLSDAMRVAKEVVNAVEDGVRRLVEENGLEGQNVGADMTIKVHIAFHEPVATDAPPPAEGD